ncbi:acyl-CoA-binding domain-containing protein 6 [Ochlerotatus camptorhynchus]|uniref:acyl-CoA-binding domain-containing protein 6 n=1 Tax=Ochlerotatus camptorhynchus TaxID=644619 RepID=UPI0031D80AC5
MSDFEDEVDLLEEEFTRATKVIELCHDQFEQKELLKFYGFFKQATSGKCNVPKPGIFNISGRAKWSAWNDLLEMTKESAMKGYIQHLTGLKPEWDQNVEGEEFKPQQASWISVSTFAKEEPVLGTEEQTVVDFIKEGNMEKVQKVFNSEDIGTVINELDDEGLGLIHWAADRGNVEILRLVIQVPTVNIDLKDSGGQTALHYASSCGNRDCVKLLVDYGADRTIPDEEGETCVDVAFDSDIKAILT